MPMTYTETGTATHPEQDEVSTDLGGKVPFKDYFMVSLASGLGYGFDAYAVNIYGIILPAITASLGASASLMGLIGSIQLVGYTIGTIGFGIAADRFGRKDTLGASILLYGATTTLGGLSHNIPFFAAMRFLTGVGGAGELAVGAPYTAEMWPARWRALGVGGIIFSLYSLGYILAGLAALYIVPRFGWEWTFIIAIVPAVAVFAMRMLLQESVRYVIEQTEDKFEVARRLQEAEYEKSAHGRARTVRAIQREALARSRAERRRGGSRRSLWQIPGVRRRIGLGWLIYTANAVGYWGLSVFLTTFMVEKFGASTTDAIKYAIMFYAAQFFFAYIGTGLADWVGRRPAGILGAVVMIVSTLIGASTDSLPTFLVFGTLMIATLGWLWGVGDTYISELFPTSIRGSAFGIAVGGGRVPSIFAPFLVGAGIDAFGGATVPFLISAGLWLLTIAGYALGPETRGRDLEAITRTMTAPQRSG
jgi:MFS transporter, putative metabolite:H+ symporter